MCLGTRLLVGVSGIGYWLREGDVATTLLQVSAVGTTMVTRSPTRGVFRLTLMTGVPAGVAGALPPRRQLRGTRRRRRYVSRHKIYSVGVDRGSPQGVAPEPRRGLQLSLRGTSFRPVFRVLVLTSDLRGVTVGEHGRAGLDQR